MKNKPVTPYCLSLQSVLNEFSKYAIKLSESSEFGLKHLKSNSAKVDTTGLKLSQELKSILLAPEFNLFIRRLDSAILDTPIVLARPHCISIAQPAYKATYEMASMSLMLRNTCLMKELEFNKGTIKQRSYEFIKNLCGKIHDLCVRMLGFLIGSLASIMGHFINTLSHEIDTRGTNNG